MRERPEAEAEITATIERDFGENRAILVLDMSGFSRCTERNGIVCFLLMIHEMKRLAVPAVTEAGGILQARLTSWPNKSRSSTFRTWPKPMPIAAPKCRSCAVPEFASSPRLGRHHSAEHPPHSGRRGRRP